MHGSGPVLGSWIGRAKPWQRVLVAVALIVIGAVLLALGHLREGVVGVVGVLLLWGAVRHRARGRTPVGGTEGEQP